MEHTKHWYNIVSWYKAGKDGGMPSGVVIIIAFIVLAPLLGALISYLISIWLLNSSKKSILPKLFTIALMIASIWFVYSQMVPYDKIEKPRFDSHLWSVVFEAHNIKWFLVAFIIIRMFRRGKQVIGTSKRWTNQAENNKAGGFSLNKVAEEKGGSR